MTKTQKPNSIKADHSKISYTLPPERDLVIALDVFQRGLAAVGAGGEALSNLGEGVNANGNALGDAICYVAGKLECDVMELEDQFKKLHAMIFDQAPAVKLEADRLNALMFSGTAE